MNAIFDIQDIGEHIAKSRKELGLSQSEVAKQAGVSRALLSGLETGQLHDPGVKKLLRILKVLGKGIRIVTAGPPTLDDLLASQEEDL
ncbi:MAG: XRE family transcriptional regulator [Proteobacteria bacterium]|nr:XRE family transcriptional regulator [Pseudomonadota bacterium]